MPYLANILTAQGHYLRSIFTPFFAAAMNASTSSLVLNGANDTRIALSVRAERIDYADAPDYGFTLTGVIKMHSYIGGVLRTTIELPTGQELLITGANPVSKYPAGCRVFVFWDPAVAAVVERGKAE